jgi:hypothetical protein
VGGEKEKYFLPSCKEWEQRLKMVVFISCSYTGELGEYMWSKIMALGG